MYLLKKREKEYKFWFKKVWNLWIHAVLYAVKVKICFILKIVWNCIYSKKMSKGTTIKFDTVLDTILNLLILQYFEIHAL